MNPFAPIRTGPETDWTWRDHQNAANFYFYERQGATEALAGPNYKPLFQMMDSEWQRHTRRAKALRLTQEQANA